MMYSALVGNPVEHSFSPLLFDILAESVNLEYAHIKIKVKDCTSLDKTLSSLSSLGFVGANVTLPYKRDVIQLMDSLSPEAKYCGAVNTIVFKQRRKMIGYNTDGIGALKSIESKLKGVKRKDRILVIGAGGAARAIVYELCKKSDKIVIINQDVREAKILADDLKKVALGNIEVRPLTEKNLMQELRLAVFVANATPVGMYPQVNKSVISTRLYKSSAHLKGKYFFDAVFNPYETMFLATARKYGAKICPGVFMMIHQAVSAFELWTGMRVDRIDVDRTAAQIKRAL